MGGRLSTMNAQDDIELGQAAKTQGLIWFHCDIFYQTL
jgi:hypothetical protein